MDSSDRKRVLSRFNGNPPASADTLAALESSAGVALPKDYTDFLRETDGGEGFIGRDTYVILWPANEVLQNNQALGAPEFVRGLILFGTDGGGEAFAFDARSADMPIVAVALSALDLDELLPVANGFGEFLSRGFTT